MTDDELMARLRAADPVPDLPPIRPARLDQLLEDTVTSNAAPTTRRPRALLLAAAAAGVLVVGGGVLHLTDGDDPTTVLTVAASDPAASCAVVTSDSLADSEVAFAGRVTDITGGTVTLETTERFAGDVSDTVEVTQGEGSVVDGAPITFEQGQSYLLSADSGTIGSCGGSGLDTPELRSLFEQAFGA